MFGFLFSPNGRVSRKGIWLGFFLPYMGVALVASLVDGVMAVSAVQSGAAPPPVGLFSMLASLFYFWPSIAVPVKRFHDRGMSGWWVLWFGLMVAGCVVVALTSMLGALGAGMSSSAAAEAVAQGGMFPLLALFAGMGVCLAQFVILYLLPGQDGPNRFGPDPHDGKVRVADFEGGAAPQAAWAERLSDPARLQEAAKAQRKAAAAAAPVAKPAAARTGQAAFSTVAPTGVRTTFGRRGV
jgi:uncharacterized membrane protein YhaH (DUF805 family)